MCSSDLRGKNGLIVGTHLYNNDPETECIECVDPNGTDYLGNKNNYPFGAWIKGMVYKSPLYIGYVFGNSIMKIGYSHEIFQDRTQNWVHKHGFLYFPTGHQHFYSNYSKFKRGIYLYSGYYNQIGRAHV